MSESARDETSKNGTAGNNVSEDQALDEVVESAESETTDEIASDKRLQEEIAALESDLAAARSQAEEYLDQWRRSAAEFQNFRKRQERERQEQIKLANAELLMRLLPVVDDLQRAIQHVPEDLEGNEWVNGVLLIERKLWSVLEQAGVQPIEAKPGAAFDPNVHDALMAEPSEEVETGHIIYELEPGYKLHERVLRPAKVVVAQ
jgi:molecular chaperone GrpE